MDMWRQYNANPTGNRVGDCVVRAISTATGKDWQKVYVELCIEGFILSDMPSANHVWGTYLADIGFEKNVIPDTCPRCYTVKEFCEDNDKGIYILATGSHVVAVIDGDYYDTWNSGDEVPVYYFRRGEKYGVQ